MSLYRLCARSTLWHGAGISSGRAPAASVTAPQVLHTCAHQPSCSLLRISASREPPLTVVEAVALVLPRIGGLGRGLPDLGLGEPRRGRPTVLDACCPLRFVFCRFFGFGGFETKKLKNHTCTQQFGFAGLWVSEVSKLICLLLNKYNDIHFQQFPQGPHSSSNYDTDDNNNMHFLVCFLQHSFLPRDTVLAFPAMQLSALAIHFFPAQRNSEA